MTQPEHIEYIQDELPLDPWVTAEKAINAANARQDVPPGTAKHASLVLSSIMESAPSSEYAVEAISAAHAQGELELNVEQAKQSIIMRDLHRVGRISDPDMDLIQRGFQPSTAARQAVRAARLQLKRKRAAR